MRKNWVEWKQPTWDEIEKVNNLLKNTRLMSFAIQDSPNHVTVNCKEGKINFYRLTGCFFFAKQPHYRHFQLQDLCPSLHQEKGCN